MESAIRATALSNVLMRGRKERLVGRGAKGGVCKDKGCRVHESTVLLRRSGKLLGLGQGSAGCANLNWLGSSAMQELFFRAEKPHLFVPLCHASTH